MKARVILIFLVAFSLVAFAATEWNPMLFKSAVDIEAGPLTVGGVTPNAASLMELQSTTQGSIFAPKMTTAQRDAIATPPSGLTIFNTDSDAYNFYDGTSWTEIGSGSGGSAGLNYYEDFDADDINNLTEFDDTAVGGDLTGGSASNLSITSNTSTPINKLASYRISKSGADASWEGVSISFSGTDIDELAKSGRPFIFSFNYETSVNYNAGTEAVSVYYFRVGTDSAAQACNGRTLGGSVSNTLGVATTAQSFSCSFNLASTTTAVRIAWVVSNTGTSTWDLDLDNIKFSPETTVPGAITSEWTPFTMSITSTGSSPTKATSPLNDTAYWRRVGDTMEIHYFYRNPNPATGSAAGTGTYLFNMPSGYTIDTSKIVTSGGGLVVAGPAAAFVGSGSINLTGVVTINNTSTFLVIVGDNTQGAQAVGQSYIPITNNSVIYTFRATVPVTQFANSNASISTTQANFSTIHAEASRSTVQSVPDAGSFTTMDLNSTITDPFGIVNLSTDRITFPTRGLVTITGTLTFAADTDGDRGVAIGLNGSEIARVFAKPNTVANSSALQVQRTIRVVEGDYASLFAFQQGSGGNLDVTGRLSIKYEPDFSTFGTYGLFEVVTAKSSVKTPANTAHYHQLTGNSVTLTAGTWALNGNIYFGNGGSSPVYAAVAGGFYGSNGADSGVAPTALTSVAGLTELSNFSNALSFYLDQLTSANVGFPIAERIVRCTQSCTVYVVTFSQQTTSSNARVTASIHAERLQ